MTDPRLLDCTSPNEIAENFRRVMSAIDNAGGSVTPTPTPTPTPVPSGGSVTKTQLYFADFPENPTGETIFNLIDSISNYDYLEIVLDAGYHVFFADVHILGSYIVSPMYKGYDAPVAIEFEVASDTMLRTYGASTVEGVMKSDKLVVKAIYGIKL